MARSWKFLFVRGHNNTEADGPQPRWGEGTRRQSPPGKRALTRMPPQRVTKSVVLRPTPVHTRNDLSAVLPAQLIKMAGKGTAYPMRRSPELVQFLCMLHRAKSTWLQDVGHGSASQSLRCDSSHKESSEGAMVTWSSWLWFCLNCPRVTWPVPLAMARARQMIQR